MFGFSRQIFEKSSTIKFHKNSSGGSRVVPRGQGHTRGRADGPDEANSRFLQFWKRGYNSTSRLQCIHVLYVVLKQPASFPYIALND